jgi:transcriptional regulator with XRE-family HTH domain
MADGGSRNTTPRITFMPKKVPPNSEFGRRLTDTRQKRGLTQVQLAELIGSTQRAISRYETVADFPPTAVVLELAKALDISADELLGIKPPKASPAPKQDPETKRLWKKFQQVRTLPEKDQRAVIRLINSLVQTRKAS